MCERALDKTQRVIFDLLCSEGKREIMFIYVKVPCLSMLF